MVRRSFSREFKLEAVRLVRERGVSISQASRDLDLHENMLRKWVKDFAADPVQAFPGQGQMKPEQAEIERLRREVAKLKALAPALGSSSDRSGGRNYHGQSVGRPERRERYRVCRMRCHGSHDRSVADRISFWFGIQPR